MLMLKKRFLMAKVIRIIDYQFRKMRKSIAIQREEIILQNKKRMKETEEVMKKIHEQRAEFERSWFKLLEGGN